MAKIKTIKINGLRGVKEPLTLDLNKKSILVYGDNGTGKSSVTDSFEWFFYDKIEHLSNEEIGRRKGRDALRNIFIPETEDSFIELTFDENKLDSKKSLDHSLKTFNSNDTDDFKKFIESSFSERLILRYRDLIQFIIAGKTDKLKELQNIIGFAEVQNIRDLLKKNGARIARNIKSANYDNLKNVQQSTILENLGQNAYTDEQLFDGANKLIKPLNLGIEIKSRKDINTVLKKIESKEDSELLNQINFYTKIKESVSQIEGNIDNINNSYSTFYDSFDALKKDPEKVKNLQLLSLLQEGKSILTKDVVEDDYCPLCQQEKSKIDLLQDLNLRIEELELLNKEKEKVVTNSKDLQNTIKPNITAIEGLLTEKLFGKEDYTELKETVEEIKNSLNNHLDESKKELTEKLSDKEKIKFVKKEIEELSSELVKTIKNLTESKEANLKFKTYTKLFQSAKSYVEYLKIEKEQSVLANQQATFELLYEDFIKRQEEALNVFLTMFSNDINDFYTTMNPNENVEDIKLVPLKKNDELVGITIEYSFFNETHTPPIAYLSESHINCLGLSFFLASVRAFNKESKFFVLDDVISSFDRSHRYRFAQLLATKFSDFQVILLTHEKEFFELVSSEVKSKGWILNYFKWTKDNGTGIERGIADIKDRIKKKIEDKNTDGLGNDIRVYAERVMKRVALEIEAKVAYRNNDINEKRMAPELLDAVQSKLSSTSKELKEKADIPKIKGMPMFIGNTTSHDNSFQESIEDLEAIWEDVSGLIRNFYCSDCDKFLSLKFYDNVESKIRCGCGKLKFDWKK
ncbi:MAG TPA: AAA family ATPase [Leadbetterella sp.]|nr:AAA family ATPase [Leadbetterella sp.]